MDFGKSDDPRVQAQLDRLTQLSVPEGRIGLETITAMMERLGNPHRQLPPVFHVAGTNGKGSTCAFLRAMLEAEGYRVHMTTSPHLVRYNERIRLAGELISDEDLATLLTEVLDACEDLGPSFFEVTIAAAFLAFSRVPADACVIEVGLGGRLDATNVMEPDVLAACGIAALGIDHEKFLLAPEDGVPTEPMARIAFEKAGIAKAGIPLVTLGDYEYPPEAMTALKSAAESAGAPLFEKDRSWGAKPSGNCKHLVYGESSDCYFHAGPLGLIGRHQVINAGLAVSMLRRQSRLEIKENALKVGAAAASWPARLQRLSHGPLIDARNVTLDGGHNASAGLAIAEAFEGSFHLILGMLDNKDPASFITPFGDRIRSLTIVPVPNHEAHPASAFGPDAKPAANLEDALLNIPHDGYPVLIAGSLYLAGEALKFNDEIPD